MPAARRGCRAAAWCRCRRRAARRGGTSSPPGRAARPPGIPSPICQTAVALARSPGVKRCSMRAITCACALRAYTRPSGPSARSLMVGSVVAVAALSDHTARGTNSVSVVSGRWKVSCRGQDRVRGDTGGPVARRTELDQTRGVALLGDKDVTAPEQQEPLAARVRFATPRRIQHGVVGRHGEHQGVQQPREIGRDDEQPRLFLLQQHDRPVPVGRHAFEARAGPEVDPGVAERRPEIVPPRAHERARRRPTRQRPPRSPRLRRRAGAAEPPGRRRR